MNKTATLVIFYVTLNHPTNPLIVLSKGGGEQDTFKSCFLSSDRPKNKIKKIGEKNMSIEELKIGIEEEEEEFEPVNLSEYAGTKSKIDLVRDDWFPSTYHEGGKGMAIKVESKVITTIQVKGKDVKIRASEILNLKKDKSGEWVISPKENSNLQKFMKHHGVKHPSELFNKPCEITLKPRKRDGLEIHFLGIKYK